MSVNLCAICHIIAHPPDMPKEWGPEEVRKSHREGSALSMLRFGLEAGTDVVVLSLCDDHRAQLRATTWVKVDP